jgi:energy-coupling factor transport system permease protein
LILYSLFENVLSWLFVLLGYATPLGIIFGLIGLTGFVEITRFEKGDSFYYKLNPVTKIVIGLVVTTMSAISIWWVGAALTAVLALSYLTLKNGVRKLALATLLTVSTVVATVQNFAPYTAAQTLVQAMKTKTLHGIWTWPAYFSFMGFQHSLTLEAVIYSLQISVRFTSITLAALILVLTTSPSGVLRALQKLGVPLPVTFALVVALRTVPRVFDSIEASMNSQFVRGLGSRDPSFLRPLHYARALISSVIPVLVFMLRGAKNTAISADTRAFRAYPRRTHRKPLAYSRLDIVTLSLLVSALALAVYAAAHGYGRAIPYVS